MTKIETNQAYSVNIELKLCFLKENFAGRRKNTQYVSGYLSKVENLEDDRQIEPESPPVLFFSLDAFDWNCTRYKHFLELDGIEIANTDELGIFRIESDRSECAQKCLQTDTCLGLFQFCSLSPPIDYY